jgi:hypothetical protein
MSELRTGFDIRNDGLCIAQVRYNDDGWQIEMTGQQSEIEDQQNLLGESDRCCLGVPDSCVIVKSLQFPTSTGASIEDIVRFELASSLLEDESHFRYESLPDEHGGRHIGLIYRDELLRELCERWLPREIEKDRISYCARALALGKGYLQFCERAEGDLVLLVDVSTDAASICFLYKDSITEMANVVTASLDLTSEDGRRKFAVDLKTIVNFKRAAMQDRGVISPLSSLVVFGEPVDREFRELLQTYFPAGVRELRFQADLPDLSDNCLVALGLAAN